MDISNHSPAKQRLFGLILGVVGAAATAFVWYNAMQTGTFLSFFAFISPVLLVFGIATAILGPKLLGGMPDSSQGRPRLRDYSWLLKIVALGSFVVGFVNVLILQGDIPF